MASGVGLMNACGMSPCACVLWAAVTSNMASDVVERLRLKNQTAPTEAATVAVAAPIPTAIHTHAGMDDSTSVDVAAAVISSDTAWKPAAI